MIVYGAGSYGRSNAISNWHGPFRQKLQHMNIVENNMYHTCGVVARPEHIVMRCQETEHLARDERGLLGETPVTDVLRTPKLVAALR